MTHSTISYRPRPVTVEAIQWLGVQNCEEVFAFIGWEHSDDELDHSQILGIGEDGEDTADPGDWIVRHPDRGFEVLSDVEFKAAFEPDVPESFTWAESISSIGGVIAVDLVRDGREAGALKLGTLSASALNEMLRSALSEINMSRHGGGHGDD